MSEKSRRRSFSRAATGKRPDQRSDPKKRYKIRKKIKISDFQDRKAEAKHSYLKEQLKLHTVETAAPEEAQPFLKWVGGKSQLLEQFDAFLPRQINRYFEPFVGGGAVFFHLKHRFPEMRAFLRDINGELTNTYVAIREHAEALMRKLDEHLANFLKNREAYYYDIRSRHRIPEKETVERAARMIFLNKTCYNGLWRVNGRGEFNVPIGSHKNPSLYDESNIKAASSALTAAHISTQDFRRTLDETRRGDFVYIDPPYYPISQTASFTSYAKENFGEKEQRELAALFGEAARRGVKLMLSNSDSIFIRELYQGFTIKIVQARRAINCDGSKRGKINEIVVCAGY